MPAELEVWLGLAKGIVGKTKRITKLLFNVSIILLFVALETVVQHNE